MQNSKMQCLKGFEVYTCSSLQIIIFIHTWYLLIFKPNKYEIKHLTLN
jgi:hypothetical protein